MSSDENILDRIAAESRPRASNKVEKKREARDRKRKAQHLKLVNAELDARQRQRAEAEPAPRDKPSMRYAGAAPAIDHQPNGAFRVYAEASPPEAKGIPNVCVFQFPSGQVGAATEQAATAELKAAFDAAVREQAPGIGGEVDGVWCAALHSALVSWLRRQWTVGRIVRTAGLWDYLAAVGEV